MGNSLTGKLLIASPSINEGQFRRKIILLAEHGDDGAYGVILNHPTSETVGKVMAGEEFQSVEDVPVYVGGPVSTDHVSFGVFWKDAGKLGYALRISLEDAVRANQDQDVQVHCFLGASSWGGGQLENELGAGSWFLSDPPAELLDRPLSEEVWAQILRSMSPYHSLLAKVPKNPLLN